MAGMVAGADCIEDMALLRHGGMGRLFAGSSAVDVGLVPAGVPVRACAAVGCGRRPVAHRAGPGTARCCRCATTRSRISMSMTRCGQTYGYAKQGAGYGYTGVKG